jgi:hypothetical protein
VAYLSSSARVTGDDSATAAFQTGVESDVRPGFFHPKPEFLKTTIFKVFGMVLA